MPLKRMPNGEWVDIADGTPPEVEARIRSQHARKANNPAPRASSIRNTFREGYDTPMGRTPGIAEAATNFAMAPFLPFGTPSHIVRGVQRGLSFNMADPIKSAIGAGLQAIAGNGSIPDNYRRNQDTAHRQVAQDYSENPYSTGAAEIAGSLVVPIGPKTGVASAATRIASTAPTAAKALAAARASKAGVAAAKVANAPVAIAARTGVNAGALNALGSTVDRGDLEHLPENVMHGGVVGGVFGLGLGGAGAGVNKVRTAIANRSADQAERVALEKIDDLLSRTDHTPISARREMQWAADEGHVPMLADLSPEMNRAAGFLAREPGNPAANKLVQAGEDRAYGVMARFHDKIRKLTGLPDDDAYKAAQGVREARKATGREDYAPGGIMDTPLKPSKELDDFLNSNEAVSTALKRALALEDNFGNAIGTVHMRPTGASAWDEAGEQVMGATGKTPYAIPTFRVLDALRRELGNSVSMAKRAGDDTLAAMYSRNRVKLDEIIDQVNPKFFDIVGRQRDAFQQEEALKYGQSFIQRIRTLNGARELLDEVNAPGAKLDDIRLGMVDALTREKNPIGLMRSMMKMPEQKEVLAVLFGSTKNLNLFDRFLRREIRSGEADKWLARGKQSGTMDLSMAGHGIDEAGSAQQIANAGMRGGAFGGPMGFFSSTWNKIDQLQRGMGPDAREELAKLLMSRGEGLPSKLVKVRADKTIRLNRRRRNAEYVGRTAGRVGGNDTGN